MRFGLREDIIDRINEVLSRFPEVREAVLYGSRAKGNFRNGSDIDLTLKGNRLDYHILSRISLQLDDLLLPYTFDLSVFNHIKDTDLIEHIQRAGKIFYLPVVRIEGNERQSNLLNE